MTDINRADAAVKEMVRLLDQAGDRDFTPRTQEAYETARRDLASALDGGHPDAYVNSLSQRLADTSDPDGSANIVREMHRYMDRLNVIGRSDSFRADMEPRVERSRATSGDFRGWMRDFRNHGFASIDLPASEMFTVRTLQSAGGSAIPTEFHDQVAWYARYSSPMLNSDVVTIENRPDGRPIIFPRQTADPAVGGTVTAELGNITELDSTISSVTVQPFGYKLISNWSRELDTDNTVRIQEVVARSAGRALALAAGAHLTTGTGTTIPWGIVTRAGNGGTASGTANNTSLDTFVGPSDLIDLKYSLAPDIWARGSYMVSSTAMAKIRKFRDADKGWLSNPMTAGAQATFDGSPVVVNPAMAAVASASLSVLFGDLALYTTVRVSPVRLEISYEAKWGSDAVSLRVVDRVSGDLIYTSGVSYLVSANV